jgi:hypothetical protein
MNTPIPGADPQAAAKTADPAPVPDGELSKFDPAHPELYLFHDGEGRVDGLSIDPAPLPIQGTDASRGLG